MRPEPHIPGPYGAVRIAAIVAALGLVFWAGQQRFDGIELAGVSLRQLAELLAVYLFLALLVERAVELVLNWRFGQQEIEVLTPLRQAAARHDAEMQILSRDSDLMFNPRDRSATGGDALMRSADEARQTLPAQVAATRQRLDMLSLEKRSWAIWVSMGLSAGLALSGFQILHGAVAAQLGGSGLPPAQLQLFAFVDVCLTTVVLAGGAGGIHRIISRLLDFGQTPKTGIVPD